MARTFEQDGFTVIVSREVDMDTDTSYFEQDYSECTPDEQEQYKEQDSKRLAAYHRGEWYYVGVCVSIRKQTASNWDDGGLEVGRASVWGIESDSDESHFEELERDMVAEAFSEVKRLREALA